MKSIESNSVAQINTVPKMTTKIIIFVSLEQIPKVQNETKPI